MALTPINWIDFIRALAGAWVLRELVVTTEAGASVPGVPLILVQGGILGVGALSQTVWRDDGLIVIGPVFYIAGAAMFLVSWQVALFAVLLGITLAQMLGRLSWMFAFAPFFFLVFAVVFGGFGLWLPVGAGLFVVPPLVAVGARAPLAMMHARSVLDRMRVPHAKI